MTTTFTAAVLAYATQPKAAFTADDLKTVDVPSIVATAKTLAGAKRMVSRAVAAVKTGVGTTGTERLARVAEPRPAFRQPAAPTPEPIDWELRDCARDYARAVEAHLG